MRILIRFLLVSIVALGMGGPASADDKKDQSGEMEAAARAFVKAYQAKDVDGMMAVADAPFAVGGLLTPRVVRTNADLRNELKARGANGTPLPTRVMKVLTWDKAITNQISSDEDRRTRQLLKPAMDLTGPDGGYAAMGDPAGGSKKKPLIAASDTRLLVAVRDGKAKVVGIVVDQAPPKR